MYNKVEPPNILYYGAYVDEAGKLEQEGIRPQEEKLVSLTEDIYIAYNEGSKHGQPVICIVDAKRMHEDGKDFYHYITKWLVDYVPSEYFAQVRIDDVLDLAFIEHYASDVVHPWGS